MFRVTFKIFGIINLLFGLWMWIKPLPLMELFFRVELSDLMRWLFGAHAMALGLLSIGIAQVENYRDQKRFAWLLIPSLACTIAAHFVLNSKIPHYNIVLGLSPDVLILIGAIILIFHPKAMKEQKQRMR